jgi:low affinity Fe/Cu permease
MNISKKFSHFARYVARISGKPSIFVIACFMLLLWLLTGFVFDFSDTWQLVINTGTTIVTFLMVFLIQNTQNRDGEAIQIKLDELIRAQKGAHNALLDLEELTEEELKLIKGKYENLAQCARLELEKGKKDTNVTEV